MQPTRKLVSMVSLRNLFSEPLLLFLLLGSAAYFLGQWRQRDAVAVAGWQMDAVVAQLGAMGGDKVLERDLILQADIRVVADELLYREALRRGLDSGDAVIRQHLAQKLLLLEEELAMAERRPSVETLRALYDKSIEQRTEPATVTFCHVFAAVQPPPMPANRIGNGGAGCSAEIGEPFALGNRLANWSLTTLADRLGPEFASKVDRAPLDRWSEPVKSKFGWHRVKVERRTSTIRPSFENLRPQLEAEWLRDQRDSVRRLLLRKLVLKYRVELRDEADAPKRERVARALENLRGSVP